MKPAVLTTYDGELIADITERGPRVKLVLPTGSGASVRCSLVKLHEWADDLKRLCVAAEEAQERRT